MRQDLVQDQDWHPYSHRHAQHRPDSVAERDHNPKLVLHHRIVPLQNLELTVKHHHRKDYIAVLVQSVVSDQEVALLVFIHTQVRALIIDWVHFH